MIGIFLLGLAWQDTRLPAAMARLFYELGALAVITAAGFLSAFIAARARDEVFWHGKLLSAAMLSRCRQIWTGSG